MLHFPSTLQNASALPRRTDSLNLNATQQKAPSHKIFLTIEEELHDARRVQAHGQEEDLRLALNMLIDRLSQLSTQLSDAYKTNADLEVQLNVAKSNLKLVISNNEMLEDALKRDSTGHAAQNVGWRRSSGRPQSTDDTHYQTPASGEFTPTLDSPAQDSGRFFKFRFTGSSPNPSGSASSSRPGTPHDGRSPAIPATSALHHLNSPSLPVLPIPSTKEKEQREELERELENERKQRKAAKEEKEALEAELESLSQALFEEANKMVATERIRRADIEEELKEARLEKEALRSALRLLEGENEHLRASSSGSEFGSKANSPEVPSTSFDPFTTSTTTSDVLPAVSALLDTSPVTQHLPPSLSALPARLPAPEPLGVPTTPFDYEFGSDTATPRRVVRQLDEEPPAPPLQEEKREESGTVDAVVDGDRLEEARTEKDDKKAEGGDVVVEEIESGTEAEHEISTTPHRPPSLSLLPHEDDPWADAPFGGRAGVLLGNTV
ncbi:hypothetical protein DXG03_002121 [Asterophora parasitica]|uniref:GDP/GTP exchange factor Sec2 N-terminal domain-containing protein n=1 Tax=Asterophora parasitica TaxID=117018 RepID=A0A9P7K8U1_9AGAR|nr:hypothetical protein DXG03_002121 [Asterophora parasitica]